MHFVHQKTSCAICANLYTNILYHMKQLMTTQQRACNSSSTEQHDQHNKVNIGCEKVLAKASPVLLTTYWWCQLLYNYAQLQTIPELLG